jgi:hypothetical protein
MFEYCLRPNTTTLLIIYSSLYQLPDFHEIWYDFTTEVLPNAYILISYNQ